MINFVKRDLESRLKYYYRLNGICIKGSSGEDCDSTLTQSWLPNLDGTNDTSSEDEEQNRASGPSKRVRKYKPLVIRKSIPKVHPKIKSNTSTLETPSSSSFVVANHSNETSPLQEKQFPDALFNMGWLSPQPDPVPDSPPRPETPTKIESVQVVIRPLLDDISLFNHSRKEKVTLNSGRVILKSLQDEIKAYQTESGRNLHLPIDLKRKRDEVKTENSNEKNRKQRKIENRNMSKRLNENEDELTMMELKLNELEKTKRDKMKMEQESETPTTISSDPTEESNLSLRTDDNEDEIYKDQNDVNEEETRNFEVALQSNQVERENNESECTTPTLENDRVEDLPVSKKFSTQLSSDPPSYDSLKTWNMMTSEDSDSNLTFTNVKESQPDSKINCFNSGEKYIPITSAPSRDQVISTMEEYGLPLFSNGHPYWSNPKDEVKLKDVRGKSLVIDSKLVRSLPEFKSSVSSKVCLVVLL